MTVKDLLLIVCLGVAQLVHQATCQGSCERITIDVFGSTTEMSNEGVISRFLALSSEETENVSVMVDEINIVCESQAELQDRYRQVSVVVAYYCESSDTERSDPEITGNCQNSTQLNIEQFELRCTTDTWDIQTQTVDPIATLDTPLNSRCLVCQQVTSFLPVDNITHCLECDGVVEGFNCNEGLGRCYPPLICCNFFYNGSCVVTCPDALLFTAQYECRCPRLSDTNGQYSFTTGEQFPGSVATLACDSGYTEADGVTVAECGDDGWSANLTCIESANCGNVTSVSNGKVNFTDFTFFESVASYICEEGYALEGVPNRTCLASGEWSPSLSMQTVCVPSGPVSIEIEKDVLTLTVPLPDSDTLPLDTCELLIISSIYPTDVDPITMAYPFNSDQYTVTFSGLSPRTLYSYDVRIVAINDTADPIFEPITGDVYIPVFLSFEGSIALSCVLCFIAGLALGIIIGRIISISLRKKRRTRGSIRLVSEVNLSENETSLSNEEPIYDNITDIPYD